MANNLNYGVRLVCPACGEPVGSFSSKCQCGHEFRGIQAVKSLETLSNNLNSTNDLNKKSELIRNFPIPNTKEDLLEFLSVAAANSEHSIRILNSSLTIWLIGLAFAISILAIIFSIGIYLNNTVSDMTFSICFFFGPLITIGYIFLCKKISNEANFEPDPVSLAWYQKYKTAYNKLSLMDNNLGDIQNNYLPIKNLKAKIKLVNGFYLGIGIFLLLSLIFAFVVGYQNGDNKVYEQLNASIEKEDWKQCENVIANFSNSHNSLDNNQFYYYFLEKSIQTLCDKGEYDKAYDFLEDHIGYFSDIKGNYNEDKVRSKLIKILNRYTSDDLPDYDDYHYYLKREEYIDAYSIYCKEYHTKEDQYKFLKDCIRKLCENKHFEDANYLLNFAISDFPINSQNVHNQYNQDYVRESLEALINTYYHKK